MQVQFSTADWVISLGLGVEVPRMREKLGSTFEAVADVMARLWIEECGPRKHSQACRRRCPGLRPCTATQQPAFSARKSSGGLKVWEGHVPSS